MTGITQNVTVSLATGTVNLTPYVMALTSDRLHVASEGILGIDRFDLPNHYLYCASIEIGLKAGILSCGNTGTAKTLIKSRIGHDLLEAHSAFVRAVGSDPFEATDVACLKAINPYFKSKGLEYFTAEMLEQALRAFTGLPSVSEVRAASAKLNAYLRANELFINC